MSSSQECNNCCNGIPAPDCRCTCCLHEYSERKNSLLGGECAIKYNILAHFKNKMIRYGGGRHPHAELGETPEQLLRTFNDYYDISSTDWQLYNNILTELVDEGLLAKEDGFYCPTYKLYEIDIIGIHKLVFK